MNGPAARIRFLPYALAFFGSLCVMILELVASRLVARHVGASLNVWTSVIGIMLGGICLGNFLGGRLADRSDPSMAIGPLYAIASALTLGCLWLNPLGRYLPAESLPDWLRTVSLVSIDFLLPGTVLGMIGPVLAKIAVEHARKAGSAIGDVYTLGAVGSIVGTFLAGYVLMYLAPTSTIITLVAAGLALMSAGLIGNLGGAVLGLGASILLGLGSIAPMTQKMGLPSLRIGAVTLNPLELVGHGLALMLGVMGVFRLMRSIRPAADGPSPGTSLEAAEMLKGDAGGRVRLGDLAALSFAISLAFMTFEMAAGRLVARHLGSSIYGWTSIIGVLLGGLSLGNFLGGKFADFVRDRRQVSWLFVAASALLLSVLFLETPPRWFVRNPSEYLFNKANPEPIIPGGTSILRVAMQDVMGGRTWGVRVFLVVFMAYFLPSVALGTVSPVLAKLAVDRVRFNNRTGGAIGSVYAWGMVGSILGTFLTGFLLIDVLGTKGVLLSVAAMLAVAATIIGSTAHAIWAGISLGLCIIAFVPIPVLQKQAYAFGLREKAGKLDVEAAKDTADEGIAYIDESNYYYIKVTNDNEAAGKMRTLVLDNLIHGYFLLGHPERLDYDYEHIYAQVADRVARAKGKAKAKSGDGAAEAASINTLFLGGGAYTFQRYILDKYPGSTVDVAEIDPAVLKANHAALGLPDDTPIVTHIGDARQYVEKGKVDRPFDIVFGDAFNDFSVPWHLTTREFNDKLAAMMAPDGVYMINIIDKFESDARADKIGQNRFLKAEADRKRRSEALEKKEELITGDDVGVIEAESTLEASQEAERARALTYGGFLAAWVKTARLTFPHVYVFGTDNNTGSGQRETFVVVASKAPLDLEGMGTRPGDPRYTRGDGSNSEPLPVPRELMDELDVRSRGIILTDDYAPVENLLAPVARTRGSSDD